MIGPFTLDFKGKYQTISKDKDFYIKNEIYFNDYLTSSLLSKIPMMMPNLAGYEILQDRAVFVSPVLIGKNMAELKDLSSSAKVEIIHKYLKILLSFDKLPLYLQVILLRRENFYLSKNELIHRGILFVEDCNFTFPFTNFHLREAIAYELLSFIGDDLSLINFKSYFRKLGESKENKSLEVIIEEVAKIYINDLFEQNKFAPKLPPPAAEPVKKNPFEKVRWPLVMLVALILIIAALSLFAILRASDKVVVDAPIAKFEISRQKNSFLAINKSYSENKNFMIVTNHWKLYKGNLFIEESFADNFVFVLNDDSNYRVELQVTDNRGYVSARSSQSVSDDMKIDVREKLDNFDFEKANFSEEEFYTGYKSIRISKSPSDLLINNLYLNKQLKVSFYVKGEKPGKASLELKGVHSGVVGLDHKEEIQVDTDWKLVSFTIKSAPVSNLQILFRFDDNVLYLDDLDLGSSGG